jgi:cell wall-associated NlpC family hydrolase
MTTHELQDLSPLIAASDYWAEDPSRPLWLRHEAGRISLAPTAPQSLFAHLCTVPELGAAEQDVSEPTVFVEWPSGRHRLYLPTSWEAAAPYEGRPYVLGQYDCYTIVRDWMARERGHEMAMLTDTPERLVNQWLTDGVFVTNPELHRWERVIVPQAGDGILFSLSRRDEDSPNRANHCGVYLGDGRFLHHFPNRASCIQDFDGRWRSWVVSFMRIKA